jgi:RNA polymerase sigma factor (sigma-70 family)
MNQKVMMALNQLPTKQKEAVYLRFNESLEYSEIAVILGINIESVRKQVHRALKTVREIISKESLTFFFNLFVKKG